VVSDEWRDGGQGTLDSILNLKHVGSSPQGAICHRFLGRLVSGVWCLMCGVWCLALVSGVLCLMSSVWCLVFGV